MCLNILLISLQIHVTRLPAGAAFVVWRQV